MPPANQSDQSIELIARGLILHQSRVLLCRSVSGNYYYLPGGHIEFGEPASAALSRELTEEAGLRITVGPLLLTTENTFPVGAGRDQENHHEVNLVFHVEQFDVEAESDNSSTENMLSNGLPTIESREDHIDFQWVDLAAASDLDIRPAQIKAWLVTGGQWSPAVDGLAPAPHLASFELPIPAGG